MSSFAPPARRGDFFYSSLLYADPGSNNPHPRATLASLTTLLRPEAPNLYPSSSSRSTSSTPKPAPTAPAKDPAWHFYAAQCIHYGLPVTKDKNAAKVRLLNAMNQCKLEVPDWILRLEGELRAEWEGECRSLRKGGGAAAKKAVATKTKGTDASGGIVSGSGVVNNGVNVTVNLFPPSGQHLYGAMSEQSTHAPQRATQAKRKRDADDSPPFTAKKTAKAKNDVAAATAIKGPQTARRTMPKIKLESTAPSSAYWPSPSRPSIKREPSTPIMRQNTSPLPSRIKPEPTWPDEEEFQMQPSVRLSGTYSLQSDDITYLFNNYDLDLTLSLYRSPNSSTWWATFRWGPWDGIVKLESTQIGEPTSFSWRLRDLETGEIKFRKECTGQITFGMDGDMQGEMWNVDGVERGMVGFGGWLIDGGGLEGDLQGEWDRLPRMAYGRRR